MKIDMEVRKLIISAFELVILLTPISCNTKPNQSSFLQTIQPSTQTPIEYGNEIQFVDGWTVFHRKVRDVIVLNNGLVLVSNSAPIFGKGLADGEPYVIAFDIRNQKVVWKLEYAPIASFVANMRSMFVVEEGRIVAIDLNSGSEQWNVPFDGLDFAQVFADEEMLLVGNSDGFYAFDVENGLLLWKTNSPLPLDMSVPLVAFFDNWRQYNALSKFGNIVLARKRVSYYESCQASLIAIDAKSGADIWSILIPQTKTAECLPGAFSMTFSNKLVILGTLGDTLGTCVAAALEESTGVPLWRYEILENCYLGTRFLILDDMLVVVTGRETLFLNVHNGRVIQKRDYPAARFQVIPNTSLMASRTRGTSEDIYSIVDLKSELVHDFRIPHSGICTEPTEIVGGSDDQIVVMSRNCLRVIDLKQVVTSTR